MFFGREAEFDLVRRRFEGSGRGGLLVFCGERRSGKTSILFQILERRLGPDFIPVLIDMQSMAVASGAEFLERLSAEIASTSEYQDTDLQVPAFPPGANHAAIFQDFILRTLRAQPDRKLILLFDEYELFENKIDAGALPQDMLHILSWLMENQRVYLVFTGSQHLEQRRKDYWKILGRSLYKQISYLEREDALNLIRKPVEGAVTFAPGVVDRIYRLGAGQPFYTQAICQSLVDQLNERTTHEATSEILDEVVGGLVNNPLPQMIFLWDGLEKDEKLVLALLAESLPAEDARSTATQVCTVERNYPLQLGKARVSTVLEKLFKSEMLVRDDTHPGPKYAFRMDLWRLWIRRMHSVWQVMREEGLEIRPVGARRKLAGWIALGGAVIAVVVVALLVTRKRALTPNLPPTLAELIVEADPSEARILVDGNLAGTGMARQRFETGSSHEVVIQAPGYADTTASFKPDSAGSTHWTVQLRELTGDVRVESTPSGAVVHVDGVQRGVTPLVLAAVGAGRSHALEARLDGYQIAQASIRGTPGQRTTTKLTLNRAESRFLLATNPPGAQVEVDGRLRGLSPVMVDGVALGGAYHVRARLEGYAVGESTITLSAKTDRVDLVLSPEPPGMLVIKGDRPAEMYVDNELIVANVPNSGPRQLRGGSYQLRVIMAASDETIDTLVVIRSRQRTTWDFSRRTVTSQPIGGGTP
jgi:hypothetical protein